MNLPEATLTTIQQTLDKLSQVIDSHLININYIVWYKLPSGKVLSHLTNSGSIENSTRVITEQYEATILAIIPVKRSRSESDNKTTSHTKSPNQSTT